MRKLIRSSQRGQSLVEFAIILPAFLFLAVMIFDLGRAVYYSSAIHNAAREAARFGIVYPDNITTIKSTAVDYAIGLGLNDARDVTVTVCYKPPDIDDFPPPSVTVTVIYDFSPATPLVSRFIPGGFLRLTGEATMKLEQLPAVSHPCY